MPITKRYLINKLIQEIKEENEEIVEPPFDIETVEDAWAGGEDLVKPIDQRKAAEIKERKKLKLKLKRIIREQLK